MNDPGLIARNLKFWTLHVCLNASGAFTYAITLRRGWANPQGIIGMLAGIAVFIVAYAGTWSSGWFRHHVPANGLRDRALRYATRVHSCLGIGETLFCLWNSGSAYLPFAGLKTFLFLLCLPMIPDGFAGALAIDAIQSLGKSTVIRSFRILVAGHDAHQRAQSLLVGDINSLVPTFLITLLDGLFLTLTLLALSFVFFVILERRSHQNPAHPAWNQPSPL